MGIEAKRRTKDSERLQDSCESWLVLFASFCGMGILIGFVRSFGLFLPSLLSTFQSNSSLTSLVSSLAAFISLIFALPASQLNDRFGTNKVVFFAGLLLASAFILSSFANSIYMLYFTYSLLFGFGNAATFTPFIVVVGRCFTKHRAVANAVLMCGSCIGASLLPVLINWLLEEYGLRSTYLLSGGIALHISVFGLLLRTPKPPSVTVSSVSHTRQEDEQPSEDGKNQISLLLQDKVSERVSLCDESNSKPASLKPTQDSVKTDHPHSTANFKEFWTYSLKLLGNWEFMLYSLAQSALMMSYPVLFISLPSYAMQLGYSQSYAVHTFLTVVAACDLVARILCVVLSTVTTRYASSRRKVPFLSDKLFCASQFVASAGWAALVLQTGWITMSAACGAIAFGIGLSLATFPVVLAHVIGGAEKLAAAHGLAMVLQAPFYGAMPVVAGFVRDRIGSWTWAYAVCSSVTLAGAIAVTTALLARCVTTSCRRDKKDSLDESSA